MATSGICRYGFQCFRPDCWFEHPDGRAIDAQADGSNTVSHNAGFCSQMAAPRQKNAQVVIFQQKAAELYVLLQLRSYDMPVMPGHLATIGGMRDRTDRDSQVTAVREVAEETGLLDIQFLSGAPGVSAPRMFEKFGEGANVDWWVLLLEGSGTFGSASTAAECADIAPMLHKLPGAELAACFGHAWIPVNRMHNICKTIPLMGGLMRRIHEAVATIG